MILFKLPDLGEGLAEAEIVEWLVKPGDTVQIDQPLVSVETAKAVVDIPSAFNGTIKKLYGNSGDRILVGNPLIEFIDEMTISQPASTTVAGQLEIGTTLIEETAHLATANPSSTTVKLTPALRGLAKQLRIDVSTLSGTGQGGAITREDILQASQHLSPEAAQATKSLHGTRRAMAHAMARAHAEVVPITVYDDVNINAWGGRIDITVRIIRAIVKACKAEPMMNAWFKNDTHELHQHINLGLAIDSDEGLFAPVLHNVDEMLATPRKIREQISQLKKQVRERTIKPADLKNATFTLSNFGLFAGRYATTVVVPPQVGILATGKIRYDVLAVKGEPKVQRIMPLSLTFDHRAVTGGEATRFLGVIMADLTLPE